MKIDVLSNFVVFLNFGWCETSFNFATRWRLWSCEMSRMSDFGFNKKKNWIFVNIYLIKMLLH